MMKKFLILMMAGLMLAGLMTSCGNSDSAETTTDATTTIATTTIATTTKKVVTNAPVINPEPITTPEKPADAVAFTWEDNNTAMGQVFYEITAQDDGSVKVNYTTESYADALANYGYAGYSWVNMAANVAEIFDGQTKLILKVQGTEGESILVKPFDDSNLQETVTFDGNVQEFVLDVSGAIDPASTYIIIFGAAGATDAAGEFTIVDAYFAN